MNSKKDLNENNADGGLGGLKRSGKAKKETAGLKFAELDDVFLNDKGKKLRNLKKKLTHLNDLNLQVKKGEIEPTKQQK